MSSTEIYCPICRWRPQASSRWVCSRRIGGCGHVWNTFHTRGVCPACTWQWEITMCHQCKQYSLHEHWYHSPPDRPELEEEREKELAKSD
jgi:hypothetical protein